MYPKILDFQPARTNSFTMSLARRSICPLIVTRGEQGPITSRFESRKDIGVVRNYGKLLIEITRTVPDGVIVFFTSYTYLEHIVEAWSEQDVLREILENKLLFIETKDPVESTFALRNYRKACENGRGAVLFAIARGKVSEGVDFDHHYGRCVLMFGIPFVNSQSRILRSRLTYMNEKYQVPEAQFYVFDAMRHAAQCVGRALRGKTDYGIMIFADDRYSKKNKLKKIPRWIERNIESYMTDLDITECVRHVQGFLREMAQPFTREQQLGISMLTFEQLHDYKVSKGYHIHGPTPEQIPN